MTHRHGCEIHINIDEFQQHNRFTNNLMFEFSWNVTSKIKWVVQGKGLLLALVRDLNEIELTLLEKDLDAVVHESEEETKETGLKTVELSNGRKSAWFNLKETAIL